MPVWFRHMLTYPLRLGAADEQWTSTRFGRLALVNNLSAVGDALVVVALAGSVFVSVPLNAARDRTALGLVCTMLPFAVVAPLTGPLTDRVRRGRGFVVLLAAAGRMAAVVMMALWIHDLLLFPAAFLALVCSKTHSVARAALVPTVVSGETQLVPANAKLAVGGGVASAVAAAVGAAIYALAGSKGVLDIDVLVFALLTVLAAELVGPEPVLLGPPDAERGSVQERRDSLPLSARKAPTVPNHTAGKTPTAGTTRRRRPSGIPEQLRRTAVAVGGIRAMTGFMTALVVFAFRSQGAPVAWYALVGAGGVAGSLAGAVIAPTVRSHVRSNRLLIALSCMLIGATAALATLSPDSHRRLGALALAFVAGLAGSVAKTAFDATVQTQVSESARAGSFARLEATFQTSWVLAAMVPTLFDIPLLAGFVTMATVLIVMGIGVLARPAGYSRSSNPIASARMPAATARDDRAHK